MNKEDVEHILEPLGGLKPLRQGADLRPLDEDELVRIEHTLKSSLPTDYRQFLGCMGGVAFQHLVSFKPISRLPSADADGAEPFSHFYGGECEGRNSVMFQLLLFQSQRRIPPDLVFVGENMFGDRICVAHSGLDRGKVFFWDHDDERSEEDYWESHGRQGPVPREFLYRNVYLVATSFVDFLSRLILAR